jgi:hypothetical protein
MNYKSPKIRKKNPEKKPRKKKNCGHNPIYFIVNTIQLPSFSIANDIATFTFSHKPPFETPTALSSSTMTKLSSSQVN